jgi:hypothetical protein
LTKSVRETATNPSTRIKPPLASNIASSVPIPTQLDVTDEAHGSFEVFVECHPHSQRIKETNTNANTNHQRSTITD